MNTYKSNTFRRKYFKNFFLLLFIFSVFTSFAQTKQQKQQIVSQYDLKKLQQLKAQFLQKEMAEKNHAIQMARIYNWPIIIKENGTYAELQKVVNGQPIYYTTFNVNAARSTRANHLHSGGSLGLNLNGQNMTAHIWDGGLARATHQEYDGPGGNNRFSVGDGTNTLHYHSAHVTGTIIASGVRANAKGMAPYAYAIGYDWNNDTAEATTAAGNGMLISNHSYGYRASQIPDQWFGAYGSDARDWDQIMHNAPYYLMVVAAGNDGNDNASNGSPLNGNSSFDKLSGHATAKNNMVVANANDANVDANGNLISVTINSSSSEGPTDDLRIKPDITGNGTSVYSTYDYSDTAYNSITGTSMASPNVAGTLLLLQQHANNVNGSFMRAATLKGLALHTADDAGINGPDAVYGWGLLNAKRAAQAITNNGNESKIEELTLNSGQTYTINVDSDGVNDLIASISWTDPAGTVNNATNSSTPALVNDLDIRVTKGGSTYYPWRLTGVNSNGKGDNTVDPFERVDVANASGTYTITISHKGSLSGGNQNYTLIITGITGSPVACNATVPTGLSVNNIASSSATVSWNAVTGTSYDLRYRQVGTSSWTTNAISGTTYTINGLNPETQYEVQVRSKCPDNTTSAYSSSQNFTTTAVQLNYCTSKGNSVADEYIGRVQLNTINNSSNGGNGYTDFTSISTDLIKDTNYTITVTPVWTGTLYNEAEAVWIDYNKDGDFSDSGELVWSASPSKTSPVSGSFTVPSSASLGATRMRVSMKYNGIPSPCETFTYGEVEDYTVNIVENTADTQAPTAPSNLIASNVTQTTVDLTWSASTDNVGVTGYNVYKDNVLLGSFTNTSAHVTGLTASTTYSFYVKAKDDAGNISESSNVVSVTTQSPPSSSCPAQVSSFPYNESFENTLGLWTQASGDDFDWTVKSGGTPSSNTGPSSATDGNYYIYMESSYPNYSNKRAILNSPCFDLSGLTQASLTFKYHMYGRSTMGSLALEASTDNGASWTVIWSKSGNQGNSWLTANIDLAAYLGGTVKLRFNGITGTTWQGDMAVDAFKISSDSTGGGCTATTLSITFDNYPEETSWEIKDSNGTVVFSGGTYESQPDGSTITIPNCLDTGCYTFIIKDSYGDGMCCSYGNGSFTLTEDATGTVLASGGSFTYTSSTNFCVGGATNTYNVTGIEDTNTDLIEEVSIYPNPAKDLISVALRDVKMKTYTITNLLGQTVLRGQLCNKPINISMLKQGVYLIKFNSDKKQIIRRFIKE